MFMDKQNRLDKSILNTRISDFYEKYTYHCYDNPTDGRRKTTTLNQHVQIN